MSFIANAGEKLLGAAQTSPATSGAPTSSATFNVAQWNTAAGEAIAYDGAS